MWIDLHEYCNHKMDKIMNEEVTNIQVKQASQSCPFIREDTNTPPHEYSKTLIANQKWDIFLSILTATF